MVDFNTHRTTLYGLKNEKKFKLYVKNKYPGTIKNLKKNGSDTNEIDFINHKDKLCVEFKSRFINHNKYKTGLLNYCKITKFKNCYLDKGYRFLVYYLYKDGLYLVNIDKKLIKTLKPTTLRSYQECRKDGTCLVVNIPVSNYKFIRSVDSYNNKLLRYKKIKK